MKTFKDFEGIDFTDWMIFKMLIKIYGEDKLISVLHTVKAGGGVREIKMRMD